MARPTPTRLSGVSITPDEGSLSASFYDEDGNYFTLMLKVRISPDASNSNVIGYDPPLLERRVPHLYTDKFTGGQHGYETTETVTLAWDEGERLLEPLARLPAESPDSRDAELLARMAQVIAARGAVAGAQ